MSETKNGEKPCLNNAVYLTESPQTVSGLPPYQYLTTKQLAKILGVSVQWLEIGRCKGYGPPFARLSDKAGRRGAIRYSWPLIQKWLNERTFSNTAEADLAEPNSSTSNSRKGEKND